jgi:hypothetical protein
MLSPDKTQICDRLPKRNPNQAFREFTDIEIRVFLTLPVFSDVREYKKN